jgi:hypothetical protein
MRAFFKSKDQLAQDEIAARQCWALQQYQGPQDKKLRSTDVKHTFLQMKDHADERGIAFGHPLGLNPQKARNQP